MNPLQKGERSFEIASLASGWSSTAIDDASREASSAASGGRSDPQADTNTAHSSAKNHRPWSIPFIVQTSIATPASARITATHPAPVRCGS